MKAYWISVYKEVENKLKNIDDQINIESKNSCLNKSLCRG